MIDQKEEIKALVPIEDIVGESVVLKPAGANRLRGLCPLHDEKTPSFDVRTDEQYFYCFSCKRGGDVFKFMELALGLDFNAALEMLAVRVGVELTRKGKGAPTRDLFEINTLAQEYFRTQLCESETAQSYMHGRGFKQDTFSTWGVGFAPDSWTSLVDHALSAGVKLELLERAGLAKDKNGRFYDVFRNRVTFPIKDLYGRVVGFSGRTLGDDPAKYLNTPETDIFKKGDLLYGLDVAKAGIRERGIAIAVEGHLDVLACHQEGFGLVVGVQSAKLTDAQIEQLARLGVTQLYLVLDADEAGQLGTLTGCDSVARRFVVKVVKLPAKDPADTVLADPEAFRTALKRAVSEPSYRLVQTCEGVDTATHKGQRAVLMKLRPAMRDLTHPVAYELREQVAQRLEISPASLNMWLGDAGVDTPMSVQIARATATSMREALCANIAALVLAHPEQLEVSCTRLRTTLLADDPLTEFAGWCAADAYDVCAIHRRLEHWDKGARALGHLARGVEAPLSYLERLLGRYAKLTGALKPPKPTTPPESVFAYAALDPNDDRLRALDELAAALPEDKCAPVLGRFTAHGIIHGRHISLATSDELLNEAAAFRSCARSWRAGRPSNPAHHLPTTHHERTAPSAPEAPKSSRHGES